MDSPIIILEFPTQQQAEACLAVINQMAEGYWAEQGFTVENHELIAKNAATGEDEPTAKTTSWDVVKESPVGTFYFTSLTGTRFAVGMAQLLPEVFGYTEKTMPPEWSEVAE